MGDRQPAAARSGNSRWKSWGGKAVPAVSVFAAGLLSGVFTTALSPVGETLRERFSPTVATVSGSVVKNGTGIWAQVHLDGVASGAPAAIDVTDDWGGFDFAEVSRGPHAISILEDGQTVSYQREFMVGVGERAKELGDMDLAAAQPRLRTTAVDGLGETPGAALPDAGDPPAVSLPDHPLILATAAVEASPAASGGFNPDWLATLEGGVEGTVWVSVLEPTWAALTPVAASDGPDAGAPLPDAPLDIEMAVAVEEIPTAERPAWLPSGARRVDITVAGAAEVLADIDRVTYALPESFNPNIVTRYDADDGFRLSLDTDETTVTATIYFGDGTTAVHVIPVVF